MDRGIVCQESWINEGLRINSCTGGITEVECSVIHSSPKYYPTKIPTFFEIDKGRISRP